MGVEVIVASDVAAQVPVEALTEVNKSILHEKENGEMDKESGPNEAIKFGSHEREVEKGVGTDVADANARRNAVAEWPVDKKIHEFRFPKTQPYFDPKFKPQFEEIDREITKKNDALARINDRLRPIKDARSDLIAEMRALKTQGYELRDLMDEKRKEMQPLRQALGKLGNNNGAGRGGICSSEEELNEVIRSLQYHIQHESIPLSEEKQILREIKQLEGTRPNVIANAATRAKIQESLGQKDAIQDQVKHMNVDYDGVKKEHDETFEKVNRLKEKIDALDKQIKVIEEERTAVKLKKDELVERLRKLRAQGDEVNAPHYASRSILHQASTLAVKKDVQGLQKLANAEMEKFMLQWREKAFRDDYKKRLVSSGSLDRRQLTLDGRMRNPDEKPIAVVTRTPPSHTEPLVKPLKKPEEPKPAAKKESLPAKKVQKKTEQSEEIEEEVAGLEKTQVKTPPPQVDAAKLKEMKREEEIAKAKLAMERKKKLAEKAAAKAAKRAEKEAEKKLKDREKKLKKKAGGSGPTNEEEKAGEEAVEGSEPDETKEAAVPVKEQIKRENPVRYRNRPRGPESVPRALLKKKKSTNYWLWAAPAAVVAVLLVLLAYYYLL